MISAIRILPAVLISIFVFTALYVSTPNLAHASQHTNQGFVSCDGFFMRSAGDCNFCDFIVMANTIIAWLIAILFIIFAIIMVVAGFKLVMSAGDVSARDKAKDMFTNAIIGIIIVFAAWLIIDSIMKVIATGGNIPGKGTLLPWNQIECTSQFDPSMDYVREGANAPDPASSNVTPPSDGQIGNGMSQDNSLNALGIDEGAIIGSGESCPAGYTMCISSTGSCTDKTISTCTSVEGLQPITAARARELQSAVGSQIIITGATETGHSEAGTYNHGNGYKLDFRTTPELNSYIENNFTSLGGSKWSDEYGNIYYRHGPIDHWDVTYTN